VPTSESYEQGGNRASHERSRGWKKDREFQEEMERRWAYSH